MGMQETIAEDTVILREKVQNKYMYMVTQGTVALYMNYGTPEEYLLGLCNKGKAFGELGLLCHDESMYTAVAVTDVTLVRFSEFELDSFVKGYPEQALGIMRSIARINKILNLNLKMTLTEAHQKIYAEAMQEPEQKNDVAARWRSTRKER